MTVLCCNTFTDSLIRTIYYLSGLTTAANIIYRRNVCNSRQTAHLYTRSATTCNRDIFQLRRKVVFDITRRTLERNKNRISSLVRSKHTTTGVRPPAPRTFAHETQQRTPGANQFLTYDNGVKRHEIKNVGKKEQHGLPPTFNAPQA